MTVRSPWIMAVSGIDQQTILPQRLRLVQLCSF
jgi:hypothetical protein